MVLQATANASRVARAVPGAPPNVVAISRRAPLAFMPKATANASRVGRTVPSAPPNVVAISRRAPLSLVLILALLALSGTLCGAESKGKFTDFEKLTGTSVPTAPAPSATQAQPAASPSKPATPAAGTPLAGDASMVSNVLAAAAAATDTNTTGAAGLNGYIPDDKYKLRVGDKVSLQILEDRDPAKGLIVADSGELDVPYIGRWPAVDKSCKQLTDELKTQLEKEYYYRATVVLALDIANKLLGRIYVWGQVKNQGPIDIAVNENLTVCKAILRAGGFGDFANKKRVKVIRGSGENGPGKQTFELNLAEIMEKGRTEKDIVLKPDDSIIVPAKLVNF